MSAVRFVAMTPDLFAWLPPRSEFAIQGVLDVAAAQRAVCAAPNVALAMLDGGRIMAAAGVVQIWPGRGTAWFQPGALMQQRHFGYALARCKRELIRLADDRMWRVECTVRTDNEAGLRWATRLGFTWEGTMTAYGPDKADHELLARVRERSSP